MSALRVPAWSACLAAIALAACSPGTGGDPPAEDGPSEVAGGPAGPGSDALRELPPEDEMFRFAGRWAESVEMCGEEPWTITSERLTAPAGVACDLTRIEKSPGGYAIDASCTIDGETQDDHIVLRFAESAKALLVEGAETLPEIGLIRCGEEKG